ncbi:MAG: hypothetical protein ACTMIA_14680 [Vibrio sp.]
MELHFLDERFSRLQAIRSEANCKSVSYLVDNIVQKIHDVTGVVFLLNRYGEGFISEYFSQHQSIACAQSYTKVSKTSHTNYNNTAQMMMRQISIDSLVLALKTLPDVVNNDILARDVNDIHIDDINDKLSILIDLSHVDGDVPFSNELCETSWLAPFKQHTAQQNKLLIDELSNYSYALSMWLTASQNTLTLLKEYTPFGVVDVENRHTI